MNIVEYRGFQGCVDWSDGRLLIQVLHIDDTLIAECLGASAVQATFEELVDDYLETCAAIGKDPSKPFKGVFNVRVEPEVHRQAVMAATKCTQTLNAWVASAIAEKLEGDRRTVPEVTLAESIEKLLGAFEYLAGADAWSQTPISGAFQLTVAQRRATARWKAH
jgi:predicted HicB family RNase H-like nuclease